MPFIGRLSNTDASIDDGSIANKELVSADVTFGGVTVSLGGTVAQPAFDLTNAINLSASALDNSTVNYGGVTVSLGSTDPTPAFDLTDATNYQTSNLSGSITNAQLAGSIENSKLLNSSVSYGGVTLSLGGSDPTPAFDLTDATNYGGALSGASDFASLLRSDANDTATGTLTVSDIIFSAGNHLQRSDHHSGHLEGSYNNVGENSTRSNPIYSIGSSYNPASTTLSNFYGIGYTNSNASFISNSGSGGWGLYVASDGDARIFLNAGQGTITNSSSIYAGGNLYYSGQTTRYLSNVTGQYGSVQVNGSGVNSWEGYSIDGRVVFMHDGSTASGIYNDVDNEWHIYCVRNDYVRLYHNGTTCLQTTSSGATLYGNTIYTTGNLSVGNGTITITQPGNTNQTFTVNQTGNTTISLLNTDTNTTYSGGSGLTLSGTTFNLDIGSLGTLP